MLLILFMKMMFDNITFVRIAVTYSRCHAPEESRYPEYLDREEVGKVSLTGCRLYSDMKGTFIYISFYSVAATPHHQNTLGWAPPGGDITGIDVPRKYHPLKQYINCEEPFS
jgi:hypothetical protein